MESSVSAELGLGDELEVSELVEELVELDDAVMLGPEMVVRLGADVVDSVLEGSTEDVVDVEADGGLTGPVKSAWLTTPGQMNEFSCGAKEDTNPSG